MWTPVTYQKNNELSTLSNCTSWDCEAPSEASPHHRRKGGYDLLGSAFRSARRPPCPRHQLSLAFRPLWWLHLLSSSLLLRCSSRNPTCVASLFLHLLPCAVPSALREEDPAQGVPADRAFRILRRTAGFLLPFFGALQRLEDPVNQIEHPLFVRPSPLQPHELPLKLHPRPLQLLEQPLVLRPGSRPSQVLVQPLLLRLRCKSLHHLETSFQHSTTLQERLARSHKEVATCLAPRIRLLFSSSFHCCRDHGKLSPEHWFWADLCSSISWEGGVGTDSLFLVFWALCFGVLFPVPRKKWLFFSILFCPVLRPVIPCFFLICQHSVHVVFELRDLYFPSPARETPWVHSNHFELCFLCASLHHCRPLVLKAFVVCVSLPDLAMCPAHRCKVHFFSFLLVHVEHFHDWVSFPMSFSPPFCRCCMFPFNQSCCVCHLSCSPRAQFFLPRSSSPQQTRPHWYLQCLHSVPTGKQWVGQDSLLFRVCPFLHSILCCTVGAELPVSVTHIPTKAKLLCIAPSRCLLVAKVFPVFASSSNLSWSVRFPVPRLWNWTWGPLLSVPVPLRRWSQGPRKRRPGNTSHPVWMPKSLPFFSHFTFRFVTIVSTGTLNTRGFPVPLAAILLLSWIILRVWPQPYLQCVPITLRSMSCFVFPLRVLSMILALCCCPSGRTLSAGLLAPRTSAYPTILLFRPLARCSLLLAVEGLSGTNAVWKLPNVGRPIVFNHR